ncbi:MAG: efflux RND transporter periplasmic adaptor subunit [Planctomycetota bacterium]|nr:efflux RND transporter periplasmic adaptor subunit [Planctomycetota bacterium]
MKLKTKSSKVCFRLRPHVGMSNAALLAAVAVTLIIAGVAYFVLAPGKSRIAIDPILQTVESQDFEAIVLEQGEVRSSENREYNCDVKSRYGGTSVKDILVTEGDFVVEGQALVNLDSSMLEEAQQKQVIAVRNAEKRVQTALSNLEAAKIAKQEYLLGLFEQDKRQSENEIFLAEEEYRQTEEIARFSERLAAKSYITDLELEAAKFAVERARNKLELARIQLEVLENQTKKRQEIKFDSDISALTTELQNEREILKTEQAQLDEIQDQITKCIIKVRPGEEGEVVFANIFSSRGNSEWVMEEGAKVREGQTLIKLPNKSKMEVFAKVNESQIKAVQKGQTVSVKVDAMQSDEPLEGIVQQVNNYPEPESWSSGGIKRFGITVRILNPQPGLRSGMNASVSVQTMYEKDAIQVPVQALAEREGVYFCFVKREESFVPVEVEVRATNAKTAWIESGLEVGERVVMAPRQYDALEIPDVVTPASQKEGERVADGENFVEPGKAEETRKTSMKRSNGSEAEDGSAS